jgi:hypothetical protein
VPSSSSSTTFINKKLKLVPNEHFVLIKLGKQQNPHEYLSETNILFNKILARKFN